MDIEVIEGKEAQVTLSGKLDFTRAPKLMDALSALRGKEVSRIVFKCKDLTYISSSGIRAIIYAQQKISEIMVITMEDACEDVVEVLEICGIADFLEFTTEERMK